MEPGVPGDQGQLSTFVDEKRAGTKVQGFGNSLHTKQSRFWRRIAEVSFAQGLSVYSWSLISVGMGLSWGGAHKELPIFLDEKEEFEDEFLLFLHCIAGVFALSRSDLAELTLRARATAHG